MAIVDQKWSALPVPYAMELPDRVPKERYFDPDFFRMEAELLWPRVWQMACRLEEIPQPHDFAEYEILDQSVIVVRTDDLGVRAFQNACRHRGVKVVEGRGTCERGFTCPFHGWCYGLDGANTRVTAARTFAEHNLDPDDIDLVPGAVRGVGRLRVDQPRPRRAAAARVHRALRHHPRRLEGRVAAGRVVVRVPAAGELEARRRGVRRAVPRRGDPSPARHPRPVRARAPARPFDAAAFVDADIHYLRTMSDGHGGHGARQRRARSPRACATSSCPPTRGGDARRGSARSTTRSSSWHRDRGRDIPDLNELEAQGLNEPMGYCFPHYFVLPMYSSASSYRFRPLGPEETLMEIWSLTRFPAGDEPRAAHTARAVGVRRSAVAADPRAGLLEPSPPAAGPARPGLRVHAPVGAGRGAHLELRADRRRLPGRPPVRAGCCRRCDRST